MEHPAQVLIIRLTSSRLVPEALALGSYREEEEGEKAMLQGY